MRDQRHIEFQTLKHLFAKHGVQELHSAFQPTERNGPTLEFFARLFPGAPPCKCLSRYRRQIFSRLALRYFIEWRNHGRTQKQTSLAKCFLLTFPSLSASDIRSATIDTVSGWDSARHVTLLSLIGEEFRIDIDYVAFAALPHSKN